MSHSASVFFVTGGTIPIGAPSYIQRSADAELYEALRQHKFCYVLNTRQMGKSSLCVRTITRLQEAGTRAVFLDLARYGGGNATPEQWYAGMLTDAGEAFGKRREALTSFKNNQALSPVQRFLDALQELALAEAPVPVVVFIDEIDAVQSLRFSTDEFFAAIRACYNRRAQQPELENLTFCLIGVATPSDLIQDARISPFNIGKRIQITDFTPAEASVLLEGLGASGPRLLPRILYWTSGHPYLTQRLCQIALERRLATPKHLDTLVSELFFGRQARTSDDNLSFVRKRLLESNAPLEEVLTLYQRVHQGKRVLYEEGSPVCATLLLSGIAAVDAKTGLFRVRNRIYERVFDQGWIRESLPDAELRRQHAAANRARLQVGGIALAILVALTTLTVWALRSRDQARKSADSANRLAYIISTKQVQQAIQGNQYFLAQGYLDDMKELIKHNSRLEGYEWTYLKELMHLERREFRAHEERIDSVSFSPDGRFALTGSRDNTARLWEVSTGQEIRTFKGHIGYVHSACFSQNGKWILTGSADKTARLWDISTGHEVRAFKGHTGAVYSVCFSLNGKWILTGSYDKTARLWDVSTGHEVRAFKELNIVHTVCFSPDDKRILTGSDDTFHLWDVATSREIRAFKNTSTYIINTACFSPDGKWILTGSADGTTRLWDVFTGQEIRAFKGHTSFVYSVCFSPDGKRVLTGSDDTTARLWEVSTGQEIRVFKGHTAAVSSVAFSPDGKSVLTGSGDKTARLWDVPTSSEALQTSSEALQIEGNTAVFSSDGKRILTGSEEGVARLWDVTTGHEIQDFKGSSGDRLSVAFSPDGKHILIGSRDNLTRLWDVDVPTGRELLPLKGHAGAILSVIFSPDGKCLLTGGLDKTARIWDASTGREIRAFKGQAWPITSVSFSPSGKQILTAGTKDGMAHLWDASTGREIRAFKGHTRDVYSVCFSPDGKSILTGSWDKTARLWDVSKGHEIRAFKGHTGFVYSACFSPDGKRILTGSDDTTARLWDVSTGREMLTLRGHRAGVNSVTFSPDGKSVLTGSEDGTVRLWRRVTDAQVAEMERRLATNDGKVKAK